MFYFSKEFPRSVRETQIALRKLKRKEHEIRQDIDYTYWKIHREYMSSEYLVRKISILEGKLEIIKSYQNKIEFCEPLDFSDIKELNNLFLTSKIISQIAFRLQGEI